MIAGNYDGSALSVPATIFRAYDIRGDVASCLTPPLVEAIGKAVATEALATGEHSLLLAYDARTHSPELRDHLLRGVLSTGCHVIDIGLTPTPLLHFAGICSDATSSGIMITASHNPKTDNGFKIFIHGRTLTAEAIQGLRRRVIKGDFIAVGNGGGSLRGENFEAAYIAAIHDSVTVNTRFTVVVDAANGAASELAPRVFRSLGCEVKTLFCEFDGEFPNHGPDPGIKSNLQPLIEAVKASSADIGLALDGDGDRLVVITPSGRIIWPDQLLMIFARDILPRHPGCPVVYDVKCTGHLGEVIRSCGGHPVMWKTGHANIKNKMRTVNAPVGGEYSGHLFFKEHWYGFDDGIYAAARLLELMSLHRQNPDAMLDSLPTSVATDEIKIPVTEAAKFSIIRRLIDTGDFAAGKKTTIDGLRVDFPTGWGLVRASNTSPALTLRFEADSRVGLEQLQTLFKGELHKIDPRLPLDF